MDNDLRRRGKKLKPTSAGAIFRGVHGLLDGREKRIALGLMGAVFVNSFVDLLGLAAVIPVIGLVVEPELITSNAILGSIYDIAYANGIGSEKRFLTLLCLLLIAAFLFKTLFGIWLNHVQSRFAFRVAHRMSGEVWLHHFSDSLERMRSKESGRVLTEINSWPVLFARVFITGGQLLHQRVGRDGAAGHRADRLRSAGLCWESPAS